MSIRDYTREGACPSIRVNNQATLTVAQYRDVLQSLHNLVGNGKRLILDDSNEVGCKHTHCSWGMCTNSPDIYDDPRMHAFPKDFIDNERVTPLAPPRGHFCPFDDRARRHPQDDPDGTWGCFYRCRIFRPVKGISPPTREEALELIANALENAYD